MAANLSYSLGFIPKLSGSRSLQVKSAVDYSTMHVHEILQLCFCIEIDLRCGF